LGKTLSWMASSSMARRLSIQQGVAMDAELFSDVADADVLGAEFDKFVVDVVGIHTGFMIDEYGVARTNR